MNKVLCSSSSRKGYVMSKVDQGILQMALIGYEAQCHKIETAIAAIRSQLGGRASAKAAAPVSTGPKRRLSAAARKRIALGQKKRWAAFHARSEKTAPAKVKRRLSPARREALAANLAKARAAKAAKRTGEGAVPF